MLHHVSVGVSNVERAARFYDLTLAALGYKRVMEFMPFAVAYGETTPELWIGMPHNQQAPSVGNGVHIALKARTRKAVHDFHEAALAGGGTDDGAPGPRPEYTPEYYGAFVRDPDGNKLEAMLIAVEVPEGAAARRGGGKGRAKGKGKARRVAARQRAKNKGKGAGKNLGKNRRAGKARGGAKPGAARRARARARLR